MVLTGISISVHDTHGGGGNYDDAKFNPRSNLQVRGLREDLFFPEAMESAKDDYWDEKLKRVMCNTEKNMADSEEPDAIGGGR